MQKKLKFNPHGVFGIIAITLILGIVFFLQWDVNWGYLVMAVGLYSVVIISLTGMETAASNRIEEAIIRGTNLNYVDRGPGFIRDDRLLLCCHFSLLFLAVGLLLHFPGEHIIWLYFVASLFGGITIPFLLLTPSEGKDTLYIHGLIALLLISLMFGIAFYYKWIFSGMYWICCVVAIILYAVITIFLDPTSSSRLFQFQLGCHIAFFFLLVGFGLHFKDAGIITGFFFASIAAGIAIPYLLFREKGN